MDKIIFSAPFGDEAQCVELAGINGGGGNLYHIYIDRLWRGQIAYRGGVWVVLPHDPDYFSMDDRDAISDRVTESNKLKS